nr:copia protein [Tanacetum cinerariifolium]GFA42203.1 copia protein [Tanacetum cinerariifolium]
MSFMGELTFFLGLKVKKKDDGVFISHDKYVAEILRKFGFIDVKSASTPIEIEKPLLKDTDDVETNKEVVALDAESQEKLNQEDVSGAEPTRFDDEDVQTAAARDKQEKADMEIALELQRQYDDKEENIDWSVVAEQVQERHLDLIRIYQNIKKKLVSIAQARKNMRIYLKNMIGYKIEYFRGMTYDKVRPIFEREYKKVQTLFKRDKDVQKPKKKRVADETLLQESFKKLRAAENMLEIVLVPEFKVEALQVKYPIIDWEIYTEEKFSSAVPSVDEKKALWVELKRLFEPDENDVLWKLQRYMHAPLTWKLYTDCEVHHVSSTRGHDIFMLTEKDYPLSNAFMILMLSGKLQVKEDNEMDRDLVMKIFMDANKPKSKSLDTSS